MPHSHLHCCENSIPVGHCHESKEIKKNMYRNLKRKEKDFFKTTGTIPLSRCHQVDKI